MWAIIHMVAWIAIVILTITAFVSYKKNEKMATILQMIDRVFYIIVIGSGIFIAKYGFADHLLLTILKILLGIMVIGIIEMLFSYQKKKKPTMLFSILFGILTILTIALGFYLSSGYPLT